MKSTRTLSFVAILLSVVVTTATVSGEVTLLIERWTPDSVETREYDTALVVGITKDLQARKRFENKLVSHLRGRDIRCTTSYSIVSDLADPGEPSAVVDELLAHEVDAVITVRLVPAEDAPEGGFEDLWDSGARDEIRIRPYIESALAGMNPEAKRYVVEIGLWDMTSRSRVWAARTDVYKLARLRKLSGRIMQDTIDGLKLDRLF